jgi:hypothetical protein
VSFGAIEDFLFIATAKPSNVGGFFKAKKKK